FDLAGDDWHKALGVAPVPGRALTYIDGTWRLVQAPWLPIPSDRPDVEHLYPPRRGQGAQRAAESASAGPPPPSDPYASYGPPPPPYRPHETPAAPEAGTSPRRPRQPATWPPPPPAPRRAAEDPTAPGDPVEEILDDFGESPEYDPGTARRRRRRKD